MRDDERPAMYGELAGWFHLLTAPEDYAEEAAIYLRLMRERCRRPLATLLELGSGGGNNASHYKPGLQVTLVDLSPAMLEVSRSINPECEHLEGDMRAVRLGRTFDAVFIHDAISYMTTEADLDAAIRTAAEHLAPGGVALFAPDETRESFKARTSHGGHDGADGRGLRYVEWVHEPQPGGTTYATNFAMLLREADRSTTVMQDQHTCGVFERATWLRLIRKSALKAAFLAERLVDEDGTYDLQLFTGVRSG